MTRVWRIVPRRYSKAAFTGRGGLLADGRWHHAGRPIVYAASSETLAALELLAHVRSLENVANLVLYFAEIGRVAHEELKLGNMPSAWDRPEPIEATRYMGDEWLREQRTAVLWVPSAHANNERNALLNPLHREFQKIKVSKPVAYHFDRRIKRIVKKASLAEEKRL